MPSEFAVFLIADALLAEGERPSLRKVREALPTGGSPREVCKHLRAWRRKRGYDPKLKPIDLSKAMKVAGQALAIDLWKQAKREATKAFDRERVNETGYGLNVVEVTRRTVTLAALLSEHELTPIHSHW